MPARIMANNMRGRVVHRRCGGAGAAARAALDAHLQARHPRGAGRHFFSMDMSSDFWGAGSIGVTPSVQLRPS